MAHSEPPHQDPCCLQIQLFSSLVVKELIARSMKLSSELVQHFPSPNIVPIMFFFFFFFFFSVVTTKKYYHAWIFISLYAFPVILSFCLHSRLHHMLYYCVFIALNSTTATVNSDTEKIANTWLHAYLSILT